MAATERIFVDFVAGVLSETLADDGTTLKGTFLASLPEVADPEFVALTLDPQEVDGAPEVVWVTAHSSASDEATVVRAQEGTVAREHLSGTVAVAAVTAAALEDLKLADGEVTTEKLANDAVTSAKIPNGTVHSGKLADGAVTTAKIGTGAVTTSKIADGHVTAAKIADGAVTNTKIGTDAVTAAKIADGAVVASRLAPALRNLVVHASGQGRTIYVQSSTPSNPTNGDIWIQI